MVIAPDRTWLASRNGGTIQIWDIIRWTEKAALTCDEGSVAALAIAPDGSWLAACSNWTVSIWDTTSWTRKATLSGNEREQMVTLAIAPDGTWLATGGGNFVIGDTVRIWDTSTWVQKAALTGRDGWVRTVAIAPDGSWLAAWSVYTARHGGSLMRIWDTATWTRKATLASRKNKGWHDVAVAIAPDGTWLAMGDRDMDASTVQIWDTATWTRKATLTGLGGAQAVAVAPDGMWLAVGGSAISGGSVRIWDTATWTQKAALTGYEVWLSDAAAAPDGTLLATCGDQAVRIWDIATGRALTMLRVDEGVYTCAWLDSRSIIVGGGAGWYLFDFYSGTAS